MSELTHCRICNGIDLVWDDQGKEWTAPYVEGGGYCTCLDATLGTEWEKIREAWAGSCMVTPDGKYDSIMS